jgi:histidine phosphotransferase ChpT
VASDDLDLSAVLASRICHDLVGPVGAIGNGLELLAEEDDPEMRQQALDLLAHSAGQATRRLTFYRLAFGASGGADVAVPLAEARSAAEQWLAGSRVRLDWPDASADPAVDLTKPQLRLLLNLLIVGSEALPRGGTLQVAVADGATVRLTVRAEGPGARVAPGLDSALEGATTAAELSPKMLPAHLAARLTAAHGGRLTYAGGAGELVLEATQPGRR